MEGPEKNSCKEFDNEKKFLRLKNSPPPITFLMVRPLVSCVSRRNSVIGQVRVHLHLQGSIQRVQTF